MNIKWWQSLLKRRGRKTRFTATLLSGFLAGVASVGSAPWIVAVFLTVAFLYGFPDD